MDQRTILALLLSITVYFLWIQWVQSTSPLIEIAPESIESIEQLFESDQRAVDVVQEDSQMATAEGEDEALAVESTSFPARQLSFEQCSIQGQWTTEGGTLSDVTMKDVLGSYDVTPLWKWGISLLTGSGSGWLPYGVESGPVQLATKQAHLLETGVGDELPRMQWEDGQGAEAFTLTGRSTSGVVITKVLTVKQNDPCVFNMNVSWTNTADTAFSGPLWVGMHDSFDVKVGRYENALRPIAYVAGGLEKPPSKLTKLNEEADVKEGEVGWFGVADRYFAFFVLPKDFSGSTLSFDRRIQAGQDLYGATLRQQTTLTPGESKSAQFDFYVGPKSLESLNSVDARLEDAVELGIFALFGRVLLALLKIFEGLVHNWGLAIILLTLVVKGVFFPLTQKSFKSSQAMQAISPQLKEIREKYKEQPEELNKRMMQLFQENKVNPLGGCLPMLIQMPVWFALYSVLLSSVELYHSEFLFLRDLSEPDPYCILPAIVVVLMVVQQRFMPTGNMDPKQEKIMKMMPLLFGFFFFTFPSGLVLYIFVNMVLTIAQQWYIKQMHGSPASVAVG